MSGPPISFESLQQRITRLRRFGGPCRGPPSLLRARNSAARLGPPIGPARAQNREHRRPRGLRAQDAPAEADHAPAAGARGVDLAVIEPALGADEHDGAARTLRVRQRGAERRRVAFPETERQIRVARLLQARLERPRRRHVGHDAAAALLGGLAGDALQRASRAAAWPSVSRTTVRAATAGTTRATPSSVAARTIVSSLSPLGRPCTSVTASGDSPAASATPTTAPVARGRTASRRTV